MIFETNRMLVRKLISDDLNDFHKMQSNPKVMKYVDGCPKSIEEHQIELKELLRKYDSPRNDFWIYAVIQKETKTFLGTLALVKDSFNNDEIGYRFLEEYWNQGYATELIRGLIPYCSKRGMKQLVAYISPKNKASKKVIERNGFEFSGLEYETNDLIYKLKL